MQETPETRPKSADLRVGKKGKIRDRQKSCYVTVFKIRVLILFFELQRRRKKVKVNLGAHKAASVPEAQQLWLQAMPGYPDLDIRISSAR